MPNARKKGKAQGRRQRNARAGTSKGSAPQPAKPKVVEPSSSSESDLFSDEEDFDSCNSSDSDSSLFNLLGGCSSRSSKKQNSSGKGKKSKKHKRSSWAYMDLLRRDDKYSAMQTELLESIIPQSSEDDGSLSEASYASSGHYTNRYSGILTESGDSSRDDYPDKAEILYKKFYKTNVDVKEMDEEIVEVEDPEAAKSRRSEFVKRLHVRQSEVKNLSPLQQLCLRCVGDNLDYYTSKQEPFKNLNGEVLEMLTKHLNSRNKLMTPQVFPLLLTPNCKYIPLNIGNIENSNDNTLGDQHLPEMIKKITENCNMLSIEELELCGTEEPYSFERKKKKKPNKGLPSLSSINMLLGQLANLKKLTLGVANITDETMSVIGSTCSQLKVLKLQKCLDQVSDKGLSYIGNATDGEHGKCKNLEVLVLHNSGGKITIRGIVSAMFHLPQLKTLTQHLSNELLYKFAEMYRNKRKLNLETFHPLKEFRHRLINVLNIMPELKSLDTGDFENYKFDKFHNLPNINTLVFRSHTPPLKIITLITNYSKQLTELYFMMYTGGNIDWSVIGYHCTNIKSITCEGQGSPPTQKCKHQLGDEHFSKLTQFKYSPCYFGRYNSDKNENVKKLEEIKLRLFPDNVLQCILSSPVLVTFSIRNVNISSKMLDVVISKAQAEEKVFSNLVKLTIHSCTVNYEKLKDIVCLSPKLKSFDCSHWEDEVLSKQMHGEFVKLLADSNIKMKYFTCDCRD